MSDVTKGIGVATPMRVLAACALACLLAITVAGAAPGTAHAFSKAEKTAYARSVAAICDYKHQPNSIVVDVSDLGLTYKQICAVYDRVAWDGRYFWVNPFGQPPKTKKSITYTCLYSDSKIAKMRKKFDKQVKTALSWAPEELPAAERVHMLHDWLCTRGGVWTHDGDINHKLAYGSIVLHKGDCQSFTLGMNALLNSAGFTTDVAYIDTEADDHSWTRVKLGGVWYNVDATWDNTYTRKYPSYWDGRICHMYLLVNDHVMEYGSPENFNDSGHRGFIAANKNTKSSYAKKYLSKDWSKTNRVWMKVGSTFTCGNFTFKVLKGHKVKAVKCASKGKATLTLPKQAAYRGHAYKITGIDAKAFAGAKAKTLVVKTPSLTKAGLKKALSKSKVKKVQVKSANVKQSVFGKYQKWFAKSNSGKKVKLSYQ
ncbi:MAG: hypothetical protein Q4D27_09055 [Coriobacteriia bacterium]|nr:hypothetical protein [Coriobacteriia bacterium]